MRLLFSWGKEIYKRRLGKGHLSIDGSDGGIWRGGSFTRDFESKVRFYLNRRPCSLWTLRDM
jgi:hypothetical protein